jgi:hypothetical protein
MAEQARPSHIPAGATADGDGVLLGLGPVRVDAFIDFLCPYCRRFELSAGPVLAGLVSDGRISLAYHPMNSWTRHRRLVIRLGRPRLRAAQPTSSDSRSTRTSCLSTSHPRVAPG